jgi:hypothetical protein
VATDDHRTSGRVRLARPDTLRGLVVGASRKGVMSVTNGQINSGVARPSGSPSLLSRRGWKTCDSGLRMHPIPRIIPCQCILMDIPYLEFTTFYYRPFCELETSCQPRRCDR